MRVIQYIKEIADERKAVTAGLEQTDTPEVLLEKVRLCGTENRQCGQGGSGRHAWVGLKRLNQAKARI